VPYFLVVLKTGPVAIHDVHETETIEWQLVGIDPDLIDPNLVD
jgi:hypothetical protein